MSIMISIKFKVVEPGGRRQAKATAKKLGKVEVDMHGTSCKVPLATEYIEKIEKTGRAGKKAQDNQMLVGAVFF